MEDWKAVAGFEGYYEVSSLGNVRRIKKASGTQCRNLKAQPDSKGYLKVFLTTPAKKAFFRVHRLVIQTFLGSCPDDCEVCHNNGIKTDNRLANLRYDSHSANVIDAVNHGSKVAKLTNAQVEEIRSATNRKGVDLAKEYGVSKTTISQIQNGVSWRHTYAGFREEDKA